MSDPNQIMEVKADATSQVLHKDSFLTKTVGALFTAAGAAVAAGFSINKNFFKNLHKYDVFERPPADQEKYPYPENMPADQVVGPREKRDHAWKTLKRELSGDELKKAVDGAEKTYRKELKVLFKEKGIASPLGKMSWLRTHQKWEAGGAAVIGGTVAVGVVAALASSRHTSDTQRDLEQRLNEIETGKTPQR